MVKKAGKYTQLYKGMSIFKKDKSQYWWGYLRVEGKAYKKSLRTSDKNEAEKFLFQWKSELLNDQNLSSTRSFSFWADRLIELQKDKPIPKSGQSQHDYYKKSFYRTNGLVQFFKHKSVDDITRFDIEEFYAQMSIDGKQLSTSYMRKHKILLTQVLNLAERTSSFPVPNPKGRKSKRRGWFNNDEYRTLRDNARELVGEFSYTARNGTTYTLTNDVHNAIIFLMGTMLRPTVDELMQLRFKDINEKKSKGGKPYLSFFVDRKNQQQTVESLSTAYNHFQKMKKGKDDNDYLFMDKYEGRTHALRLLSDMFIALLKELQLEIGRDGEDRTLYSLRHTSIIYNLRAGIDRTDIEKRADTSPDMISNWYYPRSQLEESLDDYLR